MKINIVKMDKEKQVVLNNYLSDILSSLVMNISKAKKMLKSDKSIECTIRNIDALPLQDLYDSGINLDKLISNYAMKIRYLHYLLGNTSSLPKRYISDKDLDSITYTEYFSTSTKILSVICNINDTVFHRWLNNLMRAISRDTNINALSALGLTLVDYPEYSKYITKT